LRAQHDARPGTGDAALPAEPPRRLALCDGGRSWDDITEGLPSTFGFPIRVHPRDPDTIWTLPLNGDMAGRFPPDAAAAVWRSRDGGRSWQASARACRSRPASSPCCARPWPATRRDPAGVYFGTNSGSVFASLDEGEPMFGTDFGKGAMRWYSLGFASVQPSEFLKPGFIVVAAWMLAAGQEINGPPGRLWSLILTAAIVLLLAIQPDIGQSALVLFGWGVMYFVSGAPMVIMLGRWRGRSCCGAPSPITRIPITFRTADRRLSGGRYRWPLADRLCDDRHPRGRAVRVWAWARGEVKWSTP
jgi:hypothetical protein